jgi:hypothetical protein
VPSQQGLIYRHHSMEIENNQNQGNVNDENPIPLPPRDRSKTLQPKSSLPRHQRKHPLIIPGGGVTRTLAKMQAVSSPTMEDQVDGLQRLGFVNEGEVARGERPSSGNEQLTSPELAASRSASFFLPPNPSHN